LNSGQSAPSRLWATLRPPLARVYRAARRLIEQLLHPSRRRSARALLALPSAWEGVVVLCHGNICRSPYAAAVLTQALAARGITIPVRQGGFVGPGRRSPATARSVARASGIDLRAHRSRLVTPADSEGQALVIVMETRQARRVRQELGVPGSRIVVLGDLDPNLIDTRDIIDPWRLGPEVFEEVYQRIWRCTIALAECLQQPSAHSVPGGDAPGPEGGGPPESGRRAGPRDEALHIRIVHG